MARHSLCCLPFKAIGALPVAAPFSAPVDNDEGWLAGWPFRNEAGAVSIYLFPMITVPRIVLPICRQKQKQPVGPVASRWQKWSPDCARYEPSECDSSLSLRAAQ